MIGNMDDAETQANRRPTLRLIKSPEEAPLSEQEAASISNELSRIGFSISAERLQEISTAGRATRDEAEALRTWQNLAHTVAAREYQQQELRRKIREYVLVAIAIAITLTVILAAMSSSPWVSN